MRDCFWANCKNTVKYHGLISEPVQYIEGFQLLRTDLWSRFVQQFKEDADYEGGWRGEYWGKMMRGVRASIRPLTDEQLQNIYKTIK